MSSDYYGFIAGEIADAGANAAPWGRDFADTPDHEDDPDCLCDECQVDRDDGDD